jgi:hypothetical protein
LFQSGQEGKKETQTTPIRFDLKTNLQTRTSIDDILGGNESEKIEIECRFT